MIGPLPWRRRKRPPGDDVPAICARLFSSDDGERLLVHLWAMIMDASADDAALPRLEGKRDLVRYLIRMTQKGRENG